MKKSSKAPPVGRQGKISVIMSVYNGLPYLKEAVDSVLNQTYKNFEFIIVDDASKDKTWQYLKSLKDKRIKLIKNPKNLGLARSLNIALSKAKGEFIARMDADDICLLRRFEIQLNYMINNPKIDICGSWVKLIDEKGEIAGQVHKPKNDEKIKKMNQWITGLIHPTWFAKRKVYDKLNGYDPDFDMVEDFDFLNRARHFKMANINNELLLWRSAQNRRSKKDIQEMYLKSFRLRLKYFLEGNFGVFYFPLLIRSFITTYLFPVKLKIYLNKKMGLA